MRRSERPRRDHRDGQGGRAPPTRVIDELVPLLDKGDIIIDARQRALRRHPPPRAEPCASAACTSSAPGVSGGEEGALQRAVASCPAATDGPTSELGPIFDDDRRAGRRRAVLRARRPRRRRALREDGAQRHRVRRHAAHRRGVRPAARRSGSTAPRSRDIFDEWNTGDLESFLIEITANVLASTDARHRQAARRRHRSTRPSRRAPAAGRCRTRSTWACPLTGIAEADVRARAVRSRATSAQAAPACPADPAARASDRRDAFVEDVRQALYASQGRRRTRRASTRCRRPPAKYDWDLDLGRAGHDLARRLHHPGPLPQPHQGGLRRATRTCRERC